MRKPLTFAAILLLAMVVMAQTRIRAGGEITVVDDTAKTFTCHWKTGDTTYKTNDKTTFWRDKEKASWADLKVGGWVTVTAHDEGSDKVADKVIIKAAKPK